MLVSDTQIREVKVGLKLRAPAPGGSLCKEEEGEEAMMLKGES